MELHLRREAMRGGNYFNCPHETWIIYNYGLCNQGQLPFEVMAECSVCGSDIFFQWHEWVMVRNSIDIENVSEYPELYKDMRPIMGMEQS